MTKRILIYLLLGSTIISCENDQNLILHECKIEGEDYKSKFFKKYFELDFLTNLEQAIICSEETNKQIFIMFVSRPLSGILDSNLKSYRHQLFYFFDCKKCQRIIQNNFIPVLLHTDLMNKKLFDENENVRSLNLIDQINSANQTDTIEPIKNTIKYLGTFHQKLQMAITKFNAIPSYAIIDSDGKIISTYRQNKKTLYNILTSKNYH